MKKWQLATDLISALVLLLLFYTALSKLADHARFESVLSAAPGLRPFARFLSFGIPAAEIGVAALLFIPATRLKGLCAALLLLSVFTIYLGFMVLYAPKLPCNCGGALESLSWPQHIVFNGCFILLTAGGCWTGRQSLRRTPP